MPEPSENSYFESDGIRKNDNPKCPSKLGIRSFIISFGLMGMVSWGLYTLIVSQISNIEKAFGLTSAETGWILTVWEFGYVLCTICAGYFTPRVHIPRSIGFVTIVCGIAALVCSLPHFIAFEERRLPLPSNDSTTRDSKSDSLCLSQVKTKESIASDVQESISLSKKNVAFVLLSLGMVLLGIGKAPCYPYSSQYIDDNTDKKNTGLYTSIAGSISIFGLAIGYAVGSFVSKLHVTLKPTHLRSTDLQFVGAWWFGLIILGFGCILSAIPMFFFPRRIRKTNTTDHVSKAKAQDGCLGSILKEIKTATKITWKIIKTPVYFLTLAGGGFQVFAFTAFFGFEPKYMETQFAVPAWTSNIIIGISSMLSFCVGSLIGGLVTQRYKMTPFTTLRTIILLLVAVNIVEIPMAFIGCPKRDIVPLSSKTGLGCDCASQQFLPICGVDNKNYFSPCHAGCTNGTLSEFTDCPHIPEGTATSGLCPSDCSMVWVYAVVKFIQNMVYAITNIPMFLVFLRSSRQDNKGFAVALSAALTPLFARLPAPVIGGKVIDATCLIWKTAPTFGKYCGHYDTTYQRQLLHWLRFGVRIVGVLVLGAAMLKAKKMPDDWGVAETKETGNTPEQKELAEVV